MAEPPVLRLVSKNDRLPSVIKLTDCVTFGRGAECDISFDDPKHPNMISRRHAKILKAVEGEKEVFQVEDLNSTNGILVNFLRVKTASLSDGDKISFGGAGKRPLNSIVSHPNSNVVYEFRWRTTESKKRRLKSGEESGGSKKKRKTNNGKAEEVKRKKGQKKKEQAKVKEAEDSEEDKDDEEGKENKGTIASRNKRNKRGQGDSSTKKRKKYKITKEETEEPLFKLRKICSRPALEGGKRYKGHLTFNSIDDSNSVLEFRSEAGTIVLKSSRIRHMIVQPNEGGAITLIHVYLVKPIRVGNHVKKTQFFQEALRSDNTRHINIRFLRFARTIERANPSFTLDIKPKRKLCFEGITDGVRMDNLKLQPTNHCLASLQASQPFFIIMYNLVQLVYLERVSKVSRTFDMVFVTQEDGEYDVVHINHISSSHLERLIAYFRGLDIKVLKGQASLDWEEVLEYAVNEPEEIKKNGWKFIETEDTESAQAVQGMEDDDSEDFSDFAPHSGDDFDDLALEDGEEDL